LLAAASAIALPTHATVIVDNFNPDGRYDPFGMVLAQSEIDFGLVFRDEQSFAFTVSTRDYYLNSITIPIVHFVNSVSDPSPLVLGIFESGTNGLPSVILESITDSSIQVASSYFDMQPVNFRFSGQTLLQSGHTYWVGASLGQSNNSIPDQIFGIASESFSAGSAGAAVPFLVGNGTALINQNVAFRVEGTAVTAPVPEPESYAMLLASTAVFKFERA
jgi:hypothetical protein